MSSVGASGEPTRLMKAKGEGEVNRHMSLLADWRLPSGCIVLVADGVDVDAQNLLPCDGGDISEKKYPRLFGLIGSTLPDLTADAPSGTAYYIKT